MTYSRENRRTNHIPVLSPDMSYKAGNSSGFETKNIKTVHYVSETMLYLGPKVMGSRSVDDKKFRKH